MKTNILKLMIIFIVCVLAFGYSHVYSVTPINGLTLSDGFVGGILDYSNFSKCGKASSSYNPVNDQTTFFSGTTNTTGYYGTDGKFITTQIVTTYDNGNTSSVQDVLAQKFLNFNNDGSIASAYYKLTKVNADGTTTTETYTADVKPITSGQYAGGYTLTWGDATMGADFPYTETYDAQNQLMEEGNSLTKTVYTRDANGEVTQTVRTFADGSPTITSTFKYGMFSGSSGDGSTTANVLGKKLLSVSSSNSIGQTSVTHYDNYGRVSNGTNFDGTTFQMFYNDTGASLPESFSYYETNSDGHKTGDLKTINVNVAAGGVLYSKTSKASGEANITLFHMGCSSYNAGWFVDDSGQY
jgi:hypothetical protein